MDPRFEDSWYLRFHGLMPHRVREILLVSSPYDAFTMEEDGRLMARLFHEYSELNLTELPTIFRARNARKAFELLEERSFDLVITMVNLADMDVIEFGEKVKSEFPEIPIVLFAFTDVELMDMPPQSELPFDRTFLWTGDANTLIAAIKIIEDQANVEHDTRAGVRVIIVVEDSVRHFSTFLSLLYVELMRQSGSLVAEGINDLHKRMRMRARPKVLLASTFEEALRCHAEYRHNLLALITDVQFTKAGRVGPTAGFDLVDEIRSQDRDLPIFIQSADPESAHRAADMGVGFGNKNSTNLLSKIRKFLRDDLGFGDFIFRLPDRSEVGRARDMYEMEHALPSIPDESIAFHAQHNHFSMWLTARGMFMLARELRPRQVDDFGSAHGMRQHLISVLRRARRQEQIGAITDFSHGKHEPDQSFLRLGGGSVGGKGRAIAFVSSILHPQRLPDRFEKLEIRVPPTIAIGTDEFDRFIEENGFAELVQDPPDDASIREIFLDGELPSELKRRLTIACRDLTAPIAVRSSSILEDSRQRPFAGVYSTYMLPNNHPSRDVRQQELFRAIKSVYASTFCSNARAYMANTPHALEEERMGVVIQEVVGRTRGDRFYPSFAGVVYSANFYPVAGQRSEEGLAALALGLGKTVVDGGQTVQFSPARPKLLPQFGSARAFVDHGQSQFVAIDLTRPILDFMTPATQLGTYDLSAAEEDGALSAVGSVYVPEDDAIRDSLRIAGPRVVTFNNILKWETIPLAPALEALLETMQEGFGHAVEMEIAVEIGDPGETAALYVLQVRPQSGNTTGKLAPVPDLPSSSFVCLTDVALGHGVIENIHDIIFVPEDFRSLGTVADAAAEVGELNALLASEDRPYVLIGPGRWGSSDPHLGIPVQWSQISRAKVVVETRFEGRPVEPSQGSHFFHNLVSMQLGYLTLSMPEQQLAGRKAHLDTDWIRSQSSISDTRIAQHIRLSEPLTVYLDGRTGSGAIVKS